MWTNGESVDLLAQIINSTRLEKTTASFLTDLDGPIHGAGLGFKEVPFLDQFLHEFACSRWN
jgi:hypothetical protein